MPKHSGKSQREKMVEPQPRPTLASLLRKAVEKDPKAIMPDSVRLQVIRNLHFGGVGEVIYNVLHEPETRVVFIEGEGDIGGLMSLESKLYRASFLGDTKALAQDDSYFRGLGAAIVNTNTRPIILNTSSEQTQAALERDMDPTWIIDLLMKNLNESPDELLQRFSSILTSTGRTINRREDDHVDFITDQLEMIVSEILKATATTQGILNPKIVVIMGAGHERFSSLLNASSQNGPLRGVKYADRLDSDSGVTLLYSDEALTTAQQRGLKPKANEDDRLLLLRAIFSHAVDTLLKPVSSERMKQKMGLLTPLKLAPIVSRDQAGKFYHFARVLVESLGGREELETILIQARERPLQEILSELILERTLPIDRRPDPYATCRQLYDELKAA